MSDWDKVDALVDRCVTRVTLACLEESRAFLTQARAAGLPAVNAYGLDAAGGFAFSWHYWRGHERQFYSVYFDDNERGAAIVTESDTLRWKDLEPGAIDCEEIRAFLAAGSPDYVPQGGTK